MIDLELQTNLYPTSLGGHEACTPLIFINADGSVLKDPRRRRKHRCRCEEGKSQTKPLEPTLDLPRRLPVLEATDIQHPEAKKYHQTNLDTSRPFRLRYYPRKGFGVQSTRSLQAGSEIIREKPFMTFPNSLPSTVQLIFDAASNEDRLLFLSFNAITPDVPLGETSLLAEILETNALNCWNEEDELSDDSDDEDSEDEEDEEDDEVRMEEGQDPTCKKEARFSEGDYDGDLGKTSEKPGFLGLFENISRVNHSCAPNSVYSWDSLTREMARLKGVLRALTDIHAHEEITAAYDPSSTVLPSEQRQSIFKDTFGFKCFCPACSLSPTMLLISDQNLIEFNQIQRWYNNTLLDDHPDPTIYGGLEVEAERFALNRRQALGRLDRAMEILIEERKYGGSMLEVLERRYDVYAIWGEKEKCLKMEKEITELYKVQRGEKFVQELEYCQPEDHVLWKRGIRSYGRMSTSDDGESDFEEHYRKRDRPSKRSKR